MKLRILLASAVLCASAAHAQTLNVGLAAAPTSADPHFHALTPNSQFRKHVFDGLVGADAGNRPVPELAASWRKLSDTLWRFELRPGVRFHDGTPFTARDALYSLCRVANVPNSPGLYRIYTQSIRAARAPEPLVLELETNGPNPFLPEDLSNVAMVSARASGAPERFDYDNGTCGIAEWPTTASFNAAGPVSVGTGPYRLVGYTPNDSAILERAPSHWGRAADHERVVFRILTNPAARTAALLSGAVDAIEQPPIEALERLRATPDIALFQSISANIVYMSFDQALEPSPGIEGTNGRNPFKDVRVRRAVSMAIDREAIASRILGGLGRAAHQMAADTMLGFAPDIPPEAFDPAAARRLLAEAGYPEGFKLALHTPNGRYQADVQVAQAIAQMLSRVGIDTRVEAVAPAVYFTNATNQRYSFFLAGVGANMGEALMLLRALGHSRTSEMGSLNRGRYSNPALDALVVEGLRTMDDSRREALARRALALFREDRGVLPIHREATVWAMRRGLSYEGRADQMLLAHEVRRGR